MASSPARDPFVGRTDALEQLRECARHARGGDPRIVLVEGEAGVGKTSVVQHFLAELTDFTVLPLRCDEAEKDVSYSVVDELTARAHTTSEHDLPLLFPMANVNATPHAVGAQLLALLDRLQETAPVALVIDDAQWADQQSVDAFNFVVRRIWADAVLLVLVSRPGEPGTRPVEERFSSLRNHSDTVRIRLDTFTQPEVFELARHIAGTKIRRAEAARLHQRTGGHPLYVTTVLQSMISSERTCAATEFKIPPTLGAAIRAQVDKLPEPTRRVLEALAVMNSPTPLARLAQLAGVDDISSALDAALRIGLLEWNPLVPTCPVSLRHALHRDAIYTCLSPAARSRLHREAANLVDATAALAHRVAAAEVDDELATELEQASEREQAAGYFRLAATHLRWAADVSDSRAEQERRLLLAGLTYMRASDRLSLLEIRHPVLECADTPLRNCVLAVIDLMELKVAEVEARLPQVFEAARQEPALAWLAGMAGLVLTGVYVWSGKGAEAQSFGREALPFASTLDSHSRVTFMGLLAEARAMVAGADAALRELPELLGDTTDPGIRPDIQLWEGLLHLDNGDVQRARADLGAVVRTIQENPVSPVISSRSVYSLAFAHYLAGAWEEAAVTVERSLSMAETEDKPWDLARSHMVGAFIRAGRGEWAEAEVHVRSAEEIAGIVKAQQETTAAALARAAVARARGRYGDVLTALGPMLSDPDNGYGREFAVWWRPLHIEALIGTARLAEAARELEALRALRANEGHLAVVFARLSGWLNEVKGNLPTARAVFEAGVALPKAPDESPLDRALLAHAFGRHLLRAHQRRSAVRWLETACQGFQELGAAPFLQRCEAEMNAQGNQGHTPSLPFTSLTGRERDVAQLVGRGLTNREIATELFVSAKTVEYHLSNVFAKVGVSSRRELRDHVQEHMAGV